MAFLAVALGQLVLARPGLADVLPSDDDEPDLSALSLEELTEVQVETATREPRAAREAPAIVSVITREDIRTWGFASVAEALVLVPGLYCIDDYLTADCGVRGVTGGERGYSKVLKVMIDGQPVAFRSDTTNFLGPEMLPIDLVERIEVVRGPVSALYGANAFFGAINVITRRRTDGQSAGVHVRLGDELGVDASATYVGGGSWWSASFGYTLERSDYDGRALPGSSPDRPAFERAGNLETRNAQRLPHSAFGRLELRLADDLAVEAALRYSSLDAVAELLDFGQLSHESRVVLRSLDARLQARYTPLPRLVLTGSVALADGRPGDDETLSTGATDTRPRRRFGSRELDALVEGRVRLFGDDWLTVGADYSRDREDLIEIYSVDRVTGDETLTSNPAGRRVLTNAGVYAQAIVHPIEMVGLTFNVRHDRHRIYGPSTHYRVGAVVTPGAQLALKLLYGTSYKAPPPLQLYAQPLFPGEVVGNADLRPENARLGEAELLWRPAPTLALALGGFLGDVRDKVELVPVGVNLQPVNLGRQEGWGLEAEARFRHAHHLLTGTLAYQHTRTLVTDPFQDQRSTPTERYPALTEQLRWSYRDAFWGAPALALRYVSQRRASSANVRDNLQEPYALPWYLTVDLAYVVPWKGGEVQLRVDNLLDADTAEPGFGGIDLPARGRHAWLSYSAEL
jgi:iron complex outermembrane receptor protein